MYFLPKITRRVPKRAFSSKIALGMFWNDLIQWSIGALVLKTAYKIYNCGVCTIFSMKKVKKCHF